MLISTICYDSYIKPNHESSPASEQILGLKKRKVMNTFRINSPAFQHSTVTSQTIMAISAVIAVAQPK